MHFPGKTAISATALGAVLVFAAGMTQAADQKDTISPSVVQQGFDASPIPKEKLNLKGKDVAQVALGSYLVNGAGDCNGCHTFPRFLRPAGTPPTPTNTTSNSVPGVGSDPRYGNPYMDRVPQPESADGFEPLNAQLKANTNADTSQLIGHTPTGVPIYKNNHLLAGGRCFGPFMARNITPDNSGKPRGLTEAEFIQVMRQGKDISCDPNRASENKPRYGATNEVDPVCVRVANATFPRRLQTMPWPTYHSMTDSDLKAIYAYLSTLPQTTACNAAANGCAGDRMVGGPPSDPRLQNTDANKLLGITTGANKYVYLNTDDCPNNILPGDAVGAAPPQ